MQAGTDVRNVHKLVIYTHARAQSLTQFLPLGNTAHAYAKFRAGKLKGQQKYNSAQYQVKGMKYTGAMLENVDIEMTPTSQA